MCFLIAALARIVGAFLAPLPNRRGLEGRLVANLTLPIGARYRKIGGSKPLGKPLIHRYQNPHRPGGSALIAQQSCKARCDPKFEGQNALPGAPSRAFAEMALGSRRSGSCRLHEKAFAFETQQLGNQPAFVSLSSTHPFANWPSWL
jgi:hypothetical protein